MAHIAFKCILLLFMLSTIVLCEQPTDDNVDVKPDSPLDDSDLPFHINEKNFELPAPKPMLPRIWSLPYFEVIPNERISLGSFPTNYQMGTSQNKKFTFVNMQSNSNAEVPNKGNEKKFGVVKQTKISEGPLPEIRTKPLNIGQKKIEPKKEASFAPNQQTKFWPSSNEQPAKSIIKFDDHLFKSMSKSEEQPSKSISKSEEQPVKQKNEFPTLDQSINPWAMAWNQKVQSQCGAQSICLLRNAFLPHPNDCCSFIICRNCVPHLMRCAPNTQYNPYYKTCLYPYQNFCYASNKDCHAISNEYGAGNIKM